MVGLNFMDLSLTFFNIILYFFVFIEYINGSRDDRVLEECRSVVDGQMHLDLTRILELLLLFNINQILIPTGKEEVQITYTIELSMQLLYVYIYIILILLFLFDMAKSSHIEKGIEHKEGGLQLNILKELFTTSINKSPH